MGVTIFNTAEGEKVVSVERISEPEGEESEDEVPEGGEGEEQKTGADDVQGTTPSAPLED